MRCVPFYVILLLLNIFCVLLGVRKLKGGIDNYGKENGIEMPAVRNVADSGESV